MRHVTRRRILDRMILDRLGLGRGVEKICVELCVGKQRVRCVRAKAVAAGYLDESGQRPGATSPPPSPLPLFPDPVDGRSERGSDQDHALLERLDWLRERLTAGWKPITVFEELEGAGIRGISRSSFYRFIDRHDLHLVGRDDRGPTLVAPIVHAPGESLILDWGKLRDVIDPQSGQKRTLWAFVGVLGHSRYMMVRLVWTNDVTTTCTAIESMMQELGGVPRRITSDNPKCFAIKADRHDPILNPAFSRFAAHLKFVIECLPPREPKKKGKVERMVPFARRLFEAYPEAFVSLEHAQAHMNRKVGIANERKHGTTCEKPIEAYLSREAGRLKPLPAVSYEREEVAYPKVRRDGYARFANKYYALADHWQGKEVVVVATATQLSIYGAGQLLEIYDRLSHDTPQTHATKDHLKKPWQKLEEQNAGYLALARKIGPNAEAFVRATLSRGDGFVDTRIIWGLLSLDKKYPKTAIDQAAGIALDMHTLSSRLVERLIKLTQAPTGPSPAAAPPQPPKFVRPMSVYRDHLGTAG
jgi:hypothetical protein